MHNNPALRQWQQRNCRGLRFDAAPSRDATPGSRRMAMDSPFNFSPMSPMLAVLDMMVSDAKTEDDIFDNDSAFDSIHNDLLDDIDADELEAWGSAESSPVIGDSDGAANSAAGAAACSIEGGSLRASTRQSRRSTQMVDFVDTSTPHQTRRGAQRRTTKLTNPATARGGKKVKDTLLNSVFVEQPEGESRKCSCKKSKCLKLYCECFAGGVLCDAGCKCLECMNTAVNVEARRNAVKYKLARKPRAFEDKIVDTTVVKDGAIHTRGCNCKRSGCQKKYCECYQAGVACGDACKCQGCKNDGGLMHLRDLGIKGWKAPEGGFKQSQSGLMEILSPANKLRREEPIPMCETEIELQKMLLEHHYRRRLVSQQTLQCSTGLLQSQSHVGASPSWPASDEFSKSVQHVSAAPDIPYQLKKPVQVTPRSGTMLEPSPNNEKRRCRQRTPKSFGTQQPSSSADGLLLTGQFGGELSPVAEAVESSVVVPEKLSKGILNQAQWNVGDSPGYFHNEKGVLCWGVQHERASPQPTSGTAAVPEPVIAADMSLFDVDVDVEMDLSMMRAGSPMASPLGTPRSIQVC